MHLTEYIYAPWGFRSSITFYWRLVVASEVYNLTLGMLSVEDIESIMTAYMASVEETIKSLDEELPESEKKKAIVTKFATIALAELPRRPELVNAFPSLIAVSHGVME